MASWEEFSTEFTLTTAQSAGTAVELWQNDDEPFHDRTVVDGYVGISVTTTALHTVTLYGPVPNFAVAADFSFQNPTRDEKVIWYSFACADGFLVYRIRSKRTFGPREELWVNAAQHRGGVSTVVRVYLQMLITP